MRHAPVVSAIQVPELLEFCQDAGHQVRLEGRGTLLQPPPQVLSITDWERSLRLRCRLATLRWFTGAAGWL